MSFSALCSMDKLPDRLFIEASAGTGKTFSIIHLMCQYLLHRAKMGEEFSLHEVACLTFTRAVAWEMKARLKETLLAIRDALEHKTQTGWEYVDLLLPHPSLCSSCVRAVRQALFDLDTVRVSTIHHFADRVLESWYEKKQEEVHSSWITECEVRKWLLDLLEHGDTTHLFSVYEWKAVKKYFRANSTKAFDWLVEKIQRGRENKREVEVTLLLEEIKKEISLPKEEFSTFLFAVARSLEGTCDKKGMLKSEVESYLFALIELLFSSSLEPLWELYSSSFSLNKLLFSNMKKRAALTDQERAFMDSLKERILPKIFPILDLDSVIRRVSCILREAFYEFASKKSYKTPDFLLDRFFELSENEEFVSFVRSQFRLVIVDEFQDTDPLQWNILKNLFCQENTWKGSFYVVGDPKQSIYRFRGADIYSYLDAKGTFLREECTSLSINYRATSSMVEAINKLFSSETSPSLFSLPQTNSALLAETLVSHKKEIPTDDLPIQFQLFEGHTKGRWPDKKGEEDLFSWLIALIRKERERGLLYNGIAVLVKDRYQAEKVRLALKKEGIASLLKRSELVTASLAYRWLLSALKVVLSPKKKQLYCDMLLTHPTVETLQTSHQLLRGEDPFFFAHFVAIWQRGRAVYHKGGFGALIHHIMQSPCTENSTVEEWMSSLDEYRTWQLDLEHIIELVDSHLKKKRSLEEVVCQLEELESFFQEDPGILLRRIDPLEEAVSILTMHSSKGLEFQVVFVVGAFVRSMKNEEETEEDVAEKIRQFYVSVTRAKERCYLPVPQLDEPYASISSSVIETYFAKREPISPKEQIDELISAFPHLFGYTSSLALERVPQHTDACIEKSFYEEQALPSPLIAPIEPLTFSALQRKSLPSFHPKEKVGDRQHGLLWGIRLHQACCEILRSSKRPISRYDFLQLVPSWSVPESDAEAFVDELMGLLTVPLSFGSITCTPLELPMESIHVEKPFYALLDNNPFYGVFDLLVILDSTIWIIDWKSSQEAMDLDCSMLSDLVESAQYDLQAKLYKEAALLSSFGQYRWGGFFFVFSKHTSCPHCHGVLSWKL